MLAALPVPDQFHLALVLEEQKAKLVRQRLVGFQKAEDLLLFLFSQSWHGIFLLFAALRPRVRPRGAMENITCLLSGRRKAQLFDGPLERRVRHFSKTVPMH